METTKQNFLVKLLANLMSFNKQFLKKSSFQIGEIKNIPENTAVRDDGNIL